MRKILPPFCLGFTALAFQIILMREFSVFFYGNEISFGLILGSWLLWGGVGSLAANKINFSQKRFVFLFYFSIVLFSLCLAGLRLSRFPLGTLPGEVTGTSAILLTSMILSFFISFPLGILFVFNIRYWDGKLTEVYILESLGAATSGFLVYFVLIPHFSNWQAASLVGAFMVLVYFVSCRTLRSIPSFLLALIVLGLVWMTDIPSQKIYWKPFSLEESTDTPLGTLQVLKTADQISLYSNHLPVFSYPDLSAAEESVHFALLQNPAAEKVLLIGGGVGGGAREVLKYPQTRVDYVEVNPEILQMALRHLPEVEKKAFQNPRIRVYHQDGIAFLAHASEKYDMILLNLPDPSTAQINRFYTREFFSLANKRLKPGGILSFRVSSAENYISQELQDFLSSLFYTLKKVFPSVEVVPGNTNIFLASSSLPSLNAEKLSDTIRSLNLDNVFVSPERLFSRLDPLRVESLKSTIFMGKRNLNLDLAPIAYFFNSILWSKQFGAVESKFFMFLSRLPRFWLLDLPLFLFLLLCLGLGWRKREKSAFFLVPLGVMGLTTITIEIIAIICFQTFHGYLYQKIALLMASFMTGLFLGAAFTRKRERNYSRLLLVQSGFILLSLLAFASIRARPSEVFFYIFLGGLGFLGGYLFVIANSLYLKERANYGLGYGLDLLGSFAGALAVSAVMIPLFGLPILLEYIFLLNSLCLVFLIWGFFRGLR